MAKVCSARSTGCITCEFSIKFIINTSIHYLCYNFYECFNILICIINNQLDNKTCSLVWTTSYEEANRLAELNDNDFIDALNDGLSVNF